MNTNISCAKKSKNLPKDENNELKLSYKIKKSKIKKSKNGKSKMENLKMENLKMEIHILKSN